jgi:hypothetical protein
MAILCPNILPTNAVRTYEANCHPGITMIERGVFASALIKLKLNTLQKLSSDGDFPEIFLKKL